MAHAIDQVHAGWLQQVVSVVDSGGSGCPKCVANAINARGKNYILQQLEMDWNQLEIQLLGDAMNAGELGLMWVGWDFTCSVNHMSPELGVRCVYVCVIW